MEKKKKYLFEENFMLRFLFVAVGYRFWFQFIFDEDSKLAIVNLEVAAKSTYKWKFYKFLPRNI